MSYIDNNLMNGENLLYRGKLHWAVFLWPVILFVIGIFFCNIGGRDNGFFGGMFIFAAIITGVMALIKYRNSEFGITNKRVIVKVGFVGRKSLEILLSKVEGIQVNQGALGSILNYGSIIVSGTGGTKNPFHKIAEPLEFRKKVQEQIANIQDSK